MFYFSHYFYYWENYSVGNDYPNKTFVDNNNNLVITGSSCSLDFPHRYNENCLAPFIVKLNGNNGQLLWKKDAYNSRIYSYTTIIDTNKSYIVTGQIVRNGMTEWDPMNIFLLEIGYNGNYLRFKEFNLTNVIVGVKLFSDNTLLLIGPKLIELDSNWNINWISNLTGDSWIPDYSFDQYNSSIYFINYVTDQNYIGKCNSNGTLQWYEKPIS